MKKLLLITITFLLTAGSVRAEYPLGVSLGMVKVPEPEKLAQIKAAGIDHVEVVFNYFWRNAPENECYTRAYRVKALLEEAGPKVWSKGLFHIFLQPITQFQRFFHRFLFCI